ncbi:hypothetical protein, partial [Burkholderia pseudomallei]
MMESLRLCRLSWPARAGRCRGEAIRTAECGPVVRWACDPLHSLIRRFVDTAALPFSDSTVQQVSDSTVLRFFGSSVLRFFGSSVLRFFGSSVLR